MSYRRLRHALKKVLEFREREIPCILLILVPLPMIFYWIVEIFSRFSRFERRYIRKTIMYHHIESFLLHRLIKTCRYKQLHNITENSGYNCQYFCIKVPPMFWPRKQKDRLKIKLRTILFWKVYTSRCLKNDIPSPVRGGAR